MDPNSKGERWRLPLRESTLLALTHKAILVVEAEAVEEVEVDVAFGVDVAIGVATEVDGGSEDVAEEDIIHITRKRKTWM